MCIIIMIIVFGGLVILADYKSMKANLENELSRFSITSSQINGLNNEVRQYIDSATLFFENLDKHYLSADLEIKNRLLSWIFPQKLTIENIECRTPVVNNLYSLISPASKPLQGIKKGKLTCKSVNFP
jgi:hypothetical protein